MNPLPEQTRIGLPLGPRLSAVALSFAALLACGCAVAHKRAAIPWGTAVLVRPNLPQPMASSDGPAQPGPDLDFEIAPPLNLLVIAPASPARPRVATPSPNPNAPESLGLPRIVPELSARQSASFQQDTEENLRSAERNLAAVSGKSLAPAQADLLSKIRSFLADAREAARAGDWARARELSKKAQVLSDELAASP
ncbi:MAG TPA: hypothetical protein VJN42_00885 [Candidatus Acidoferrum sp.]|nr:hypothetical protein [Candidatus Acidoferrum sp.]